MLIRSSRNWLAGAALLLPMSGFAANHTIQVGGAGGQVFDPPTLSIAAGDTVTFFNAGGFHNVQSDPGAVTSFRCAAGCDGAGGNGNLSSDAWTATVTFNAPGTVGYYCEAHGAPGEGMFGSITVNVPVDLQSFDIE
ncbi:plastocyanin/azurin family copper-binding protein [Tahibacter amnicola]|uniref:Plastocyanin/azurin family copper-binding protein n=1 Tax=Tahibacter amnicola TaxID=2976241 RepID=A0ABY6BDX5_9GAMM|nr:plastocyanin/azurin family copper-binding protein [Tahibacter amnicola]UXI66520.1 plastocyanin/azurin family copper-binding protein [Tahibacter amnicola]